MWLVLLTLTIMSGLDTLDDESRYFHGNLTAVTLEHGNENRYHLQIGFMPNTPGQKYGFRTPD